MVFVIFRLILQLLIAIYPKDEMHTRWFGLINVEKAYYLAEKRTVAPLMTYGVMTLRGGQI